MRVSFMIVPPGEWPSPLANWSALAIIILQTLCRFSPVFPNTLQLLLLWRMPVVAVVGKLSLGRDELPSMGHEATIRLAVEVGSGIARRRRETPEDGGSPANSL